MSQIDLKELYRLSDALLDRTITEDEKDVLEKTLAKSETARRAYVRHVKLNHSLEHYASESDLVSSGSEIWDRPEGKNVIVQFTQSSLKWAAAIIIGFIVAIVSSNLNIFQDDATAPLAGNAEEESVDLGVAVLIQSFEAEWGDAALSFQPGDSIPPGLFQMDSGVVQLEFYSGVTMILEGKTQLDIKSTDLAFCETGKMAVNVSPHATGFAIETADRTFVDLGTQFGLRVNEDQTELHVFDGEVAVYEGSQTTGDPYLTLKTGEAAQWSSEDSHLPIEIANDGFWDVKRLVQQADNVTSQRFWAWQDMAESIEASPDIIAFFPFYQSDPWIRELEYASAVKSKKSKNNRGAIVGSQWEEGRWPLKSALRFNRPGDRVRFNIRGKYESITFATWIKVESLKNHYNGLFMTDHFSPGNPHWQILKGGRIQLGIKTPKEYKEGISQYVAVSPKVITPEIYGKWIHIASSFDGKTSSFRHYLNGALIKESAPQEPSVVKLIINSGELGNWGLPLGRVTQRVRNFDGAMDEMAVFKRVLTPEEVADLYEIGSPNQLPAATLADIK